MGNYSDQHFLAEIPDLADFKGKVGVITAQWNTEVTSKMKSGALDALRKSKIQDWQIHTWDVPGSYELIYGASKWASDRFDAIVCIGVIIQGETRHFDFISHAVADGLTNVTVKYNIPIGFGVLTTDNMQQALDRAGGKHGNKGFEAAVSVLQMLNKTDPSSL